MICRYCWHFAQIIFINLSALYVSPRCMKLADYMIDKNLVTGTCIDHDQCMANVVAWSINLAIFSGRYIVTETVLLETRLIRVGGVLHCDLVMSVRKSSNQRHEKGTHSATHARDRAIWSSCFSEFRFSSSIAM